MKKLNSIPRQEHEKTDPVPMMAPTAFKRPLSAHERVMRALRQQSQLQKLESEPGDDSFDEPPYENLTPYQLMEDPESGQEITAGEYVMLQHERAQARIDVEKAQQKRAAKKAALAAKKALIAPGKGKRAAKGEDEDSTESSESDDSGEEN